MRRMHGPCRYQGGRYRPFVVHRIKASLDGKGEIVAWDQTIVAQSFIKGSPFEMMMKDGIDPTMVEGAQDLPYAVPNFRTSAHLTSHAHRICHRDDRRCPRHRGRHRGVAACGVVRVDRRFQSACSRAIQRAAKDLQHPRCVDCHPRTDRPLQGDLMRVHQPPVTRGRSGARRSRDGMRDLPWNEELRRHLNGKRSRPRKLAPGAD